jgi:hypothetical protein
MRYKWYLALVLVAGCAGWTRECSNFRASGFGADWVVVQFGLDGTPFSCWKLTNVGVDNEASSDGIFWKDSKAGHLVHISGWYNRVQVEGGDFATAAALLGVDVNRCVEGRYK